MKTSVTLVFSALFFIAFGSYLYLNPKEAPIAHQAEVSAQLLPQMAGEEVTFMQIQNTAKKETVTLVRDGGRWKIKFPVNYPADPLVAEGLVTAFRLSSKVKRMAPAESWEDYGLQLPSIRVGIQIQGVPGRRYLSLGNPSPVGDFVFARWDKENEYFLLNADLKKVFDISLYSLREKRIFRTPHPEISEVRVHPGSEVHEIVKRDGEWSWYQPQLLSHLPISQPEMDDLLLQFQNLYVKEFLDNEKDLNKTGIATKRMQVEIWGGSENPETLIIGKEFDVRDAYYAGLEGGSAVFLVARNNIDLLMQTVFDMAARAEEAKRALANQNISQGAGSAPKNTDPVP